MKLKKIPSYNKGLAKLPKKVRNKMGFMKDGGPVRARAEEAMTPVTTSRVRGYR